jgi:hypothetical protein
MALSSPDSTSPVLIGLPGFGAGAACCAGAADAVNGIAKIAAKAKRLANRRFVMSRMSVGVGCIRGMLERGFG